LARLFFGAFGVEDWGYLAGLWHDIGEYSEEFHEQTEQMKELLK